MDEPILAVIVTTFLRDTLLSKTLQNIIDYGPKNCIVLVGDQGYNDDKKNIEIDYFKSQMKIEYHRLPFDCGLSFARNYLVDRAYELGIPYTLMMADSIQFIPENNYDFTPIIEFLKQDEKRGLVGFDLENSKCQWEYLISLIPEGIKFSYSDVKLTENNIEYTKVDICRNIFLAKTKTLLKLWDNELKLCLQKDTPILLKNSQNEIRSIPIKNLFCPSIRFRDYYKFDKNSQYKIWNGKSWKKLIAISKNKNHKEILNISTKSGFINTTKNHKFIVKGNEIQAKNLNIGENIELLKYPKLENSLCVDVDFAWLLGFFLAEGTCKPLSSPRIEFTNQNIEFLKKCENILNKNGIECAWYINKNRKDKCCFLRVKNPMLFIGLFKEFYHYNDKIIPYYVYKFNKKGRESFIRGFWDGDGTKKPNPPLILNQKSAAILNGIIYLSQDIYKNWSIKFRKNSYGNWFTCNLKNGHNIKKWNIITCIKKEKINEEVYDIEVENNTFCAGIGNINVHNCEHEKAFIDYKNKGHEVYWTNKFTFKKINTITSEEYQIYRKRLQDYIKILKTKLGITGWVIYPPKRGVSCKKAQS